MLFKARFSRPASKSRNSVLGSFTSATCLR